MLSYPAMSWFNGVPFLVPVGCLVLHVLCAEFASGFVSLGRDPSL